MILRNTYLNQLKKFRDTKIIKVVTGIRRSGKSTLLLQYMDYLKSEGVAADRIHFFNLESAKYSDISNSKELYTLVSEELKGDGIHYVMIDEVQNVEHFEKAVNSLMVDYDIDLYVTGSNAYMLSSEIATLLSGRYVEVRVFPLSFKEYLSAQMGMSREDAFFQYMRFGGFPFLATIADEDVVASYLDGIYNTIVLKDVVKRNAVRDITLLENVLRMALSSIGSPISSSSIAKALKNEKRRVSNETIDKYLDMLVEAFILDKAVRYDIKGKEYLRTLGKYYVADMGLRNHILGYRQIEPGQAVENIVFTELLRRGYRVDIGKTNEMEINFVAKKQNAVE